MKPKIKARIRIIIDILLIVLFLLTLISISFPNIRAHEIIGLSTIVVILIHLVLNWNWIKGITKNVVKGKAIKKIIIRYIVFLLLVLSFIVSIISGIAISSFLHPSRVEEDIIALHSAPSVILYLMIIVHLIQHILYLKSKLFGKRKDIRNLSEKNTAD